MKQLLLLLLIVTATYALGQSTVSSVPNPKSASTNGYVSNPDGILSGDEAGLIDNICYEIEQQDSFQVAFVILESIGDEVPKDFAFELFNAWGLGHNNRDDGLLVLFVLDQRAIEFETGYGTETIMPDYLCVQLQEEKMIPFFRNENYGEGLVAGARAIQETFRGQTVDIIAMENLATSQEREEKAAREQRANSWRELIITVLVWHAIGLLLFLITLIIARFRHDPYAKYNTIKYFGVWIWAVLFPITHIFVVLAAKSLKQRYRDMIRFSGKTGEIMRKLSDTDEDEYLSRGQITEELVKSVDYDVWICAESKDVLVLAYRPLFTAYTTCPKCHFKTYTKAYDRQLVAPTYSSSGSGERKYECKNCKHVDIQTYTIARLQKTSTTSGSRGWVGSGSSGGSFSGGGSWGGGRSGGGGGGSRW